MNDATHELTAWREVNATSIQRGDRVDLDGLHRRVVDMCTLPRNGKRLVFEDGGAYCLAEGESLYAYRDPA